MQVERLRDLIRDHLAALTVLTGGASREETDRLVREGLLTEEEARLLGDDAFGSAWVGGHGGARLKAGDSWPLARVLRAASPLGPAERAAVEAARRSAAQYVQGAGNEFADALSALVIEADEKERHRHLGIVRAATVDAVEKRRTAKALVTAMRERGAELTRDLDRVAVTELHNAHEEGVATWIASREGPKARVAKVPSPGACEDCLSHYAPTGTPRVFALDELASASNFGQPRSEWKPTLEALHPNCRCSLVSLPEGWSIGADGTLTPAETKNRSGIEEWNRRAAAKDAETALLRSRRVG